MQFISITHIDQLSDVDSASDADAAVIFKHSTSCSISQMALSRFERGWNSNDDVPVYLLDLIAYRDVSNAIAEKYSVRHESPQVLVIKNQKASYVASHYDIRPNEVEEAVNG